MVDHAKIKGSDVKSYILIDYIKREEASVLSQDVISLSAVEQIT